MEAGRRNALPSFYRSHGQYIAPRRLQGVKILILPRATSNLPMVGGEIHTSTPSSEGDPHTLDMPPPNRLHPSLRPFSRRFFSHITACIGGLSMFLNLSLAGDTAVSNASVFRQLESAEFRYRKAFVYQRTERDPFVDSSVKLTLLSQTPIDTSDPEIPGIASLTRDLYSDLLQSYKITGLVCGERDGAVLIGRRILRVGDRLDLLLREEVVKKLHRFIGGQHPDLHDIINLAILPLSIVSISPTGIRLSHGLLQEPFILPFQKNTPGAPVIPSPSNPK